ncbi:hypothetical protein AMECASPLE_026621 [Ameca splendens]|uniref:Secreted protein n=1 Tax=Ameca splendens TaxID=208324 RepID=A0ABV0Z4I0_9TELE
MCGQLIAVLSTESPTAAVNLCSSFRVTLGLLAVSLINAVLARPDCNVLVGWSWSCRSISVCNIRIAKVGYVSSTMHVTSGCPQNFCPVGLTIAACDALT